MLLQQQRYQFLPSAVSIDHNVLQPVIGSVWSAVPSLGRCFVIWATVHRKWLAPFSPLAWSSPEKNYHTIAKATSAYTGSAWGTPVLWGSFESHCRKSLTEVEVEAGWGKMFCKKVNYTSSLQDSWNLLEMANRCLKGWNFPLMVHLQRAVIAYMVIYLMCRFKSSLEPLLTHSLIYNEKISFFSIGKSTFFSSSRTAMTSGGNKEKSKARSISSNLKYLLFGQKIRHNRY